MKMLAPRRAWIFVVLLCAVIFTLRFWMNKRNAVFLTTTSPNKIYSVNLKGYKGRPLILPGNVSADLFKSGQAPFSDIWLHTAYDAFDISFELAYPEVRWVSDSTLELYQPQYFEDGADSLIVLNRASNSISYLRVQAANQFLLFDVEPGTFAVLSIPAPRGDSQYVAVQGVFRDGRKIPFISEEFDRRSTRRKSSVYEITIGESSSTIAPALNRH